jgi:hypothetical protein
LPPLAAAKAGRKQNEEQLTEDFYKMIGNKKTGAYVPPEPAPFVKPKQKE